MTNLINLTAEKNDPLKKGQFASKKVLFGEHHRYCVFAVHTRFDAVQWFVNDAETLAKDGGPETIRQEDSLEAALEGLVFGELL